MSDVLFVNATEALSLNQEVNGVMLLATKLLQAGFDAQILRFGQSEYYGKDYSLFVRDITDRIFAHEPKCVSFYTLWPTYHAMIRIAQEIKVRNPDIIVVFGGPQATGTAQATIEAMRCVDYVCAGEGENTVVPFFTALLRDKKKDFSSVPGLTYRENGRVVNNNLDIPLCDLNTLPRWDERLLPEQYFHDQESMSSDTYFMPIDAGRGCPYNCTFCRTSLFWHRTYRLKSPERIKEDILYYNKTFGIKSFWFSHDAFTSNQKLVGEVCDHIIDSGLDIKWRCTARVDCITEPLIQKMIQAGMTQIELGIETGSPRMQKLVKKNLNLTNAKNMVSYLLKNKLRVALFFMYGFPEETEEDLNETIELLFSMIDLGISYASMAFCRFFPMTNLTERFYDELVWDPEVKVLMKNVFGLEDELDMVREHKKVFPHFYHLHTPVRDEFQNVNLLARLYRELPKSVKYLRDYYKGDNLSFYRDFYKQNKHILESGDGATWSDIQPRALEILENCVKDLDMPYKEQLKALFKYEINVKKVFSSKEDASLRETYDFSYVDFKLKLPIENYSKGKTEILIQKVNGISSIKVLGMQ